MDGKTKVATWNDLTNGRQEPDGDEAGKKGARKAFLQVLTVPVVAMATILVGRTLVTKIGRGK